ncbi:MAG: NAD(P)/FAD-dependent oxidoreductase [Pseudomonadota bacterium]
MSDDRYDIIIVGGGHNGLTCAAYLAQAGRRVLVLEARERVGGAAVTETFHPGFRNSLASYTVSLLHPQIIDELCLHDHGLEIVNRPIGNFMPIDQSQALATGATLEDTQAEFARHSRHDARVLPDYYAWLERAAAVLRARLLETPPNAGGGLADLWRAGRLANDLRKLDGEDRDAVLSLFTASAADVLDGWFENPHIKALFGFDAVVGNFASPFAGGSAYVLLHHVFGEVNGVAGAWGHAMGGMGAISDAMAAAATTAGAEIRCASAVSRVAVEAGRVVGVTLSDGGTLRAPVIAANVTPKRLCLELMAPGDLPETFLKRVSRTRYGSGTFRMNVALDRAPEFPSRPGAGPHLAAGIIMAPTLEYMERAYSDARTSGWSREPIVEMLVPSTLDDSLAPEGKHVASLFCQHVAPELPDGQDWDDARDTVAQHMIDTVDRFAPGFADSVLGYKAMSPADLERILGLTGGDIFHGALALNQLYSARPVIGAADYRLPVAGLYLCGSGAHPGGGVTGIPGYNAAREILKDRHWRAG